MGYCSLRLVQGPAIEPVALAEARAHLRIDGTYDDTTLASHIEVARALAEQHLNKALITQTLCYTLSPSRPPVQTFPGIINPIIFVAPLNWTPVSGVPINLPAAPVQSVTGIVQRRPDGTAITLTAGTDYYADTSNDPGRVTLRGVQQGLGTDTAITYVAGYGDAPGDVPKTIRHAILMLVAWLYENRGDGDMPAQPNAVNALLDKHRLVTFG